MKEQILLITTSYPRFRGDPNGFFIHEFAKNLDKKLDVIVVCPWDRTSKKEEVIDNIQIFRFRQFFIRSIEIAYGDDIMSKLKANKWLFLVVPFFILNMLIKTYWIKRKHKIKKVHAMWLLPSGMIGAILKFFSHDTILICSLLGADINGFDSIFGKTLKSMILRKTDCLISQSKALAGKAQDCGYTKKVHFLPLSIDCDLYKPGTNKRRVSSCFPELLFVGTLNERKGIENLINACNLIKSELPNFRLKVIGDGPLMAILKRRIHGFQLEDQVEFLGYKDPADLPYYFLNCNIFILPSLSEGLPLVVLSALSSGCVTVVTDLEAYSDLVQEYPKILHLIPESNSEIIASMLFHIVKNFDEYRELAKENATTIHRNFDNKVIVERYFKLIKENG